MKMNNQNKKKVIYILVLLALGILFYLCMGSKWVSMEDDTIFYINPSQHEGVMPLYPLFIFGTKIIFGSENYLSAIVVIQSLLAIVCTLLFTLFIQKQFHLKNWEGVLLYIACMLPFSIYLPQTGITHQILTEGVAYPLFYVYFLFILQFVFSQKNRYLFFAVIGSVVLALIRSQLLLLLGIDALFFLIIQVNRSKGKAWARKFLKVILSGLAGAVTMLLTVVFVYRIYSFYLDKQLPVIRNWGTVKEAEIVEVDEVSENQDEETTKIVNEPKKKTSSASQFTTVLMIRGFYEVDPEDVDLFETDEMKEIFRRVYAAVDQKQYRYVYARQDLYIWKDLICDRITTEAYKAIEQYSVENPGLDLNYATIVQNLGIKVLLKHFDRYLYHTWRMMVSGFISAVFFQIEPIYLLCHFITLFLFLFAVIGSVVCFRQKRDTKVVQFMMSTVIFIISMVAVVNLLFFGLQRYMVYAMGIFYCGLYLITKELLLVLCEKHQEKRFAQRIIELWI